MRYTQGTQAELRAAVLRALALHGREGIPWNEIAIVARSLEPYAPFLQHTFESLGVPFATSASLPLGRAPGVRTFLGLLRVYSRDFERGAVIAILRHGGLRLEGEPPTPVDIDRWDRWSRQCRIVRGLSQWRELSCSSINGSREATAPNETAQQQEQQREFAEHRKGELLGYPTYRAALAAILSGGPARGVARSHAA